MFESVKTYLLKFTNNYRKSYGFPRTTAGTGMRARLNGRLLGESAGIGTQAVLHEKHLTCGDSPGPVHRPRFEPRERLRAAPTVRAENELLKEFFIGFGIKPLYPGGKSW